MSHHLGFCLRAAVYFHFDLSELQLPISVVSHHNTMITQISLLDLCARRVIAFQIRTMGSSSLSHMHQSTEQTHDNTVSSAERTIKRGTSPGPKDFHSESEGKGPTLITLFFPVQPSFVITARLQRKRWPRSTNAIWHKENISRLLLIKATLVESVICQGRCKGCRIRQKSPKYVSFSLKRLVTLCTSFKMIKWNDEVR